VKKKPRLSICIPTFNRRKYISETINSILIQVADIDVNLIEICISDNASTDGTDAFIQEIKSESSVNIVYSRNDVNVGADRNYLRSVELASGDYCWFMGSDDIATPGSLHKFLQEIDNDHDIYICNRIDCDAEMNQIAKRYWLRNNLGPLVVNLSDPEQFQRYARNAKSLGAFFSYLSSIVFKREKWISTTIDPVYIGSAYSHVYMLLSFIKIGCTLKYLPDHLVLSRGYNDSFLAKGQEGYVERVLLDIRGYLSLAKNLSSFNHGYFNALLNVLHKERTPIFTAIDLRYRANEATWDEASKVLLQAGYSKYMLYIANVSKPILMAARGFVRIARHFNRKQAS